MIKRLYFKNKHLRPFNIAFTTIYIILLLICIKYFVHGYKLEFLEVNTLVGSAIAGGTFICSFLLSGLIADYKEAEKVPTEIRSSLENIWSETLLLKNDNSKFHIDDTRNNLMQIVKSFFKGISHKNNHVNLEPCISAIDDLSNNFKQMVKAGLLPNYVVRLKTEQGNLRKTILRVQHIQKTQFLPSAYILAESIVALVIFLLLFVKTEGSPESMIVFGLISYMFIYIIRLIREIEQPFQEGVSTLDDVSLFLLHDFEQKISTSKSK